jgi:3-isopropylmalate/(R)-2-methylmalate dehydratase small subunit
VWALQGAGFRAVIAPSFGDIFAASALRNGLLPVALPAASVTRIQEALARQPGGTMTVDLVTQTVRGPGPGLERFEVDAFARQGLLEGRDEIDLTLAREAEIQAFEARQAAEWPWLENGPKNFGGPSEVT